MTVGLYRSTEGSDGLPVAVTDESGDPLTLTLSDANGWKGTFENLPRFDEEGTRYLYTVKEETVGENPAEESGFIVHTDGGYPGSGRNSPCLDRHGHGCMDVYLQRASADRR